MSVQSYQSKTLEEAIQSISEVFTESGHPQREFRTSQELLTNIFKLVTDYLGIETAIPYVEENDQRSLIFRMAREANLRARKITLEEKWWLSDSGPLIAFYKGEVCALIPQLKGGYELISHLEEKPILVNSRINKFLDFTAYCFYRTFKSQLISAKEIFAFGMRGLGKILKQVMILEFFVTVLTFVFPVFSGILFDSVIPASDLSLLGEFSIALFVVVLISLLLEIAQSYLVINLRFKFQINFQPSLWDRILSLPLSFFKEYQAGDLTFRTNSLNTIQELVSQTFLLSIIRGAVSITSLILMLYYSRILTLFSVLSLLVILLVIYYIFKKKLKYKREVYKYAVKEVGLVFQTLTGLVNFRVSHAEDKAFKLWSDLFSKKSASEMKAGKYENLYELFVGTVVVVNTIILFLLVYGIGIGDKLTFGDFIAFNGAFSLFSVAIFTLTNAITTLVDVIPLAERMRPIFFEKTDIEENRAEPHRLKGHILIKNVAFRYNKDEEPIYTNLNLEINPGETVGIVGPSGSGKSTLFRLLLGLEVPEEGDIFYDEVNTKMIKLSSLRSQLGVVSQKSVLFPGSIFLNITNNNPRLTKQDAWEIAEKVGAVEMIKGLPMGMETAVIEGMQTLSGGETQRIILARALIHKPRVILLDEATSALDNIVQARVKNYLKEIEATQIIIAHRLSTLMDMDTIHVIDQGIVVESGTYKELLEKSGLFARLAESQFQ